LPSCGSVLTAIVNIHQRFPPPLSLGFFPLPFSSCSSSSSSFLVRESHQKIDCSCAITAANFDDYHQLLCSDSKRAIRCILKAAHFEALIRVLAQELTPRKEGRKSQFTPPTSGLSVVLNSITAALYLLATETRKQK